MCIMKNVILLLTSVFLLTTGTGCLKDKTCKNKSPQSEESTIQAYASAQGITAVKHSSGLYYQIIDPGTGAQPGSMSKVKATYVGKLLNGTIFDQMATPPAQSWNLNDLIEGWKIGLPLIKQGGTIKLIVPSALAYGCGGAGPIPGDAILYFELTLVEVIN